MARLKEDPYPMPEYGNFGDYKAYDEAQKEALDAIEDPIIRFPIADGYALYRVVDIEHVEACECCGRGGEPLLQHIPYGDGYQARAETIRGLTTEDVRKRVERSESPLA